MTTDEEHLRLLSIFHYVVGGLTALFGCFPIVHVTLGLLLVFAPEMFNDGKGKPPPDYFGLIFVLVGGAVMSAFWTFAACMVTAGRFLSLRKHYMFCLVMAALACMCSPFGTVLGVFTIIVLMRESVKQLFAANSFARPSGSAGGPLV